MLNKTTHFTIKTLCMIIALAWSFHASADATLNFHSLGANYTFLVKNNQVYAKNFADGTDLLFDQAANHVIVIQHANQSYSVLNDAEIQSINQQIGGLQNAISSNLSKDQRSQLNDFLGGVLGSDEPQQASNYSIQTKGGAQVGNFQCQQYEVFENNQSIGFICSSSSGQLQLNQNDYNTLMAFQNFAVKANNQLRDSIGSAMQIQLPNLEKTSLNELLIFSKVQQQTDPDFYLQQTSSNPVTENFSVPSNYQPESLLSASNFLQ